MPMMLKYHEIHGWAAFDLPWKLARKAKSSGPQTYWIRIPGICALTGCPGGSDAPAEAIPKFLPAECGHGSIIWLRLHGQIWKQHSNPDSSVWSFHKNTCSSVGKSGDPWTPHLCFRSLELGIPFLVLCHHCRAGSLWRALAPDLTDWREAHAGPDGLPPSPPRVTVERLWLRQVTWYFGACVLICI